MEHAGAKKLIAEIEGATPTDEYYDAKVTVLSEMIKHHVKEEEQPGGMFAKARKSEMDLADLGQAHGCAQEGAHEFFRIILVASLTSRARRRRARLTSRGQYEHQRLQRSPAASPSRRASPMIIRWKMS